MSGKMTRQGWFWTMLAGLGACLAVHAAWAASQVRTSGRPARLWRTSSEYRYRPERDPSHTTTTIYEYDARISVTDPGCGSRTSYTYTYDPDTGTLSSAPQE